MATAYEPQLDQNEIWRRRAAVQTRLVGVRRAMRVHLLWEGLAWTASTIVALAAASLLFDWLVRPELSTRIALLAISVIVVCGVIWKKLIAPQTLRFDDLDLAELLDRRQPGVGQRLVNVLQLPLLMEQGHIDGSPAMIEAAVMDDSTELEKVDLKSTLNVSRRRKLITAIAVLLAGVAVAYAAMPGPTQLWAKRWFAGSSARWPQRTYLQVLGLDDEGRVLVPRGEAVVLQVSAQPEFAEADEGWRVAGRHDDFYVPGEARPGSSVPDGVTIDMLLADGSRKQGNFMHYEGGLFRYELPPINQPATFTLRGDDDWLGPVEIVPVDRPSVKNLTLTAWPPGKEKPEVHKAGAEEGQLLFLPTTRLRLEFESDQPLEVAKLMAHGVEPPSLTAIDDSHYRAEWTMKDPLTVEFQLVSVRGRLESKPSFLTIGLLHDRAPRVTIRATGVGRRVTAFARIPLMVRAVDDFGVAKLDVELEKVQAEGAKVTTTQHEAFVEKFTETGMALPTDIESQPVVKLMEYKLVPGNTVRLRGRADDAFVLGTQNGQSRWLPFVVVTPEELFYEILTRQRAQRAKFAKALEMAKGQLTAMQELTSIDEASGFPRVHQVTARQVWQIAGDLDATLQEMINNDLGSAQARDLLQQSIIEPMRTMHGAAFGKAQQNLQTLLAQKEVTEEHRAPLIESQQQIVDEMQRIYNHMSQWESFIDVVNQLRNVIKSENSLLEHTNKILEERLKGLFDE